VLLGEGAGSPPPPLAHPCGRAAKALDDAGHRYEIKRVKGGRLRPWTWPSYARDRAEVEQLSGQRQYPVIELPDGEVYREESKEMAARISAGKLIP